MKTWEELTAKEISEKLTRSQKDITEGRVISQTDMDNLMEKRLHEGLQNIHRDSHSAQV